MSYVIAAPEMMAASATDLATVGSDLSAAHTAAAIQTVALVPAAADEVSASIAHLFSQHAQDYQALAGKAAAFNDQFVQHLHAGAVSYATTEAALTAFLHGEVSNVVNALAGLKLAIEIPIPLVTSPIWIPLLLILSPLLLLGVMFLGVLAAA